MRRSFLLLLLAGCCCQAQFSELATTDDGAQVYFTTSLRLKTENGLSLPLTPAIYRINNGRVERFSEPPKVEPSFPLSHGSPQVSGGGEVVAYTLTRRCVAGSSCVLTYPTTYYTYVSRRGQPDKGPWGGRSQISRNGRYVINWGSWSSMSGTFTFDELNDLQTGAVVQLPVWPANGRQVITSDGRVLGYDRGGAGDLVLWSQQAVQPIPAGSLINDRGTWVAYERRETPTSVSLHSRELSTGRTFDIARRIGTTTQPSISNDGTRLLYVAVPQEGQPAQVFFARTDGTGQRPITDVAEGISEAVLAGFGKVAWAITSTGRILRADVESGEVTEVVPTTPTYNVAYELAPGAVISLRGTGLSSRSRIAPTPLPRELDGVRVLVDEQPMPILSIAPQEVSIQLPFELQDFGRTVRVEVESRSQFDSGVRSILVPRKPIFASSTGSTLVLAHQNFEGVVTSSSPARPNEIVHAFATGLGAVTPATETGVPTPLYPLFWLAGPFDCRLGTTPVEVKFAGLAPGMIGVYQVSVQMPSSLPTGLQYLECGSPGNSFERQGGSVPTASNP